ncbi:hypothetical protein C7M84_000275 [Penaeus vannamei]|uniref:Uncharacterized protein n=1 Tax=Penaeus vannamei TaxID=6689 RepID=A0A3R7MGE6_PENVA|nr:hypothetical protein C7M84_000275 [Penaeus vannamei]
MYSHQPLHLDLPTSGKLAGISARRRRRPISASPLENPSSDWLAARDVGARREREGGPSRIVGCVDGATFVRRGGYLSTHLRDDLPPRGWDSVFGFHPHVLHRSPATLRRGPPTTPPPSPAPLCVYSSPNSFCLSRPLSSPTPPTLRLLLATPLVCPPPTPPRHPAHSRLHPLVYPAHSSRPPTRPHLLLPPAHSSCCHSFPTDCVYTLGLLSAHILLVYPKRRPSHSLTYAHSRPLLAHSSPISRHSFCPLPSPTPSPTSPSSYPPAPPPSHSLAYPPRTPLTHHPFTASGHLNPPLSTPRSPLGNSPTHLSGHLCHSANSDSNLCALLPPMVTSAHLLPIFRFSSAHLLGHLFPPLPLLLKLCPPPPQSSHPLRLPLTRPPHPTPAHLIPPPPTSAQPPAHPSPPTPSAHPRPPLVNTATPPSTHSPCRLCNVATPTRPASADSG